MEDTAGTNDPDKTDDLAEPEGTAHPDVVFYGHGMLRSWDLGGLGFTRTRKTR